MLLKLPCHNISVLIQVAYDLGMEAMLSMRPPKIFELQRLASSKMAWA